MFLFRPHLFLYTQEDKACLENIVRLHSSRILQDNFLLLVGTWRVMDQIDSHHPEAVFQEFLPAAALVEELVLV